jgi:hypothetical protein
MMAAMSIDETIVATDLNELVEGLSDGHLLVLEALVAYELHRRGWRDVKSRRRWHYITRYLQRD